MVCRVVCAQGEALSIVLLGVQSRKSATKKMAGVKCDSRGLLAENLLVNIEVAVLFVSDEVSGETMMRGMLMIVVVVVVVVGVVVVMIAIMLC